MAVAKGVAGGYMPLGAALYSDRVNEAILAGYGEVQTGHTFTGHTAACAAGNAVQALIAQQRLTERVQALGPRFRADLGEALARFDEIGDIRGRGFFVGVEFVTDRATKAPFPRERQLAAQIGRSALERGLICYPCSGHIAPDLGDTVILAPPYNASDGELAEIVEKFAAAVEHVLSSGA